MHYDAQKLAGQLPDFAIHLHDEVTSTQAIARDMLDAAFGASVNASLPSAVNFKTPALIAAHQQTQGKGRGSNRWLADQGSIAVTFVLDAPGQVSPLELPLRTGLAVRQALTQWLDPAVIQIKWPNDVWVQGKKIAGVLCERRHNKDLIGIGLNVNVDIATLIKEDPAAARRATSLHEHLPAVDSNHSPATSPATSPVTTPVTAPSRQNVLIAIAQEIAKLWQQTNWCDTLNDVHALTGQDISVLTPDGPIAGVCEGIDTQGRLLLRTGQRLHHLLDGTIQK